VKHNDRSDH